MMLDDDNAWLFDMSWHRQHMQWTREKGRNLLIEVSNSQFVVSNEASKYKPTIPQLQAEPNMGAIFS